MTQELLDMPQTHDGPQPGRIWTGDERITKVFMTPEWATELLSRNPRNRGLKEIYVQELSSDLRAGRFAFTHEAIAVDRNGDLTDGQHRLAACVRTGVGFWVMLGEGFAPETRETINTGRIRTAADLITMDGQGEYSGVIAAAARMGLSYDRSPERVWSTTMGISKAALLAYEREHRTELLNAARLSTRLSARVPMLTMASATALVYLIVRDTEHPDRFEDFYERLISGVGLKDGDPRLAYRNRANNESGMWRTQAGIASGIKVWNAHLKGRSISALRFSRSELPVPKVS